MDIFLKWEFSIIKIKISKVHFKNNVLNNTSCFRYCALAVERLNLDLPKSPEVWSRGNSDLEQWRKVVVLYTLRLMLAPLVETVVLLDRMLYVMEGGKLI